jgi:nucleoside-diphosphate-sugar epimerase
VIAVSRFSNPALPSQLQAHGVETIAGDLLDADFVRQLPAAENVIYLVGTKFGSDQRQAYTWATNAYLPGLIASRFPKSRIVALSTGNVYGPVPCDHRGSKESDPLRPVGEYAMSCVGRERVLEHFCHVNGTPTALIRLNYAVELRYGVLVDLAQLVCSGKPVSLEVGYANVIWQRDACDWILQSLALCASPPLALNVTGPERVSCPEVCERFGQAFGCPVHFVDEQGPTALLSDASLAIEQFGSPGVSLDELIELTAHWISRGNPTWDKPTRFERSDGVF